MPDMRRRVGRTPVNGLILHSLSVAPLTAKTSESIRMRAPLLIGLTVVGWVLAFAPVRAAPAGAAENAKPNFVVIFIDDMGYGDIRPFGSQKNDTPHLDRMAEQGRKLTSFYVAASCCTPSRAALMTGCYPKRVGLATGSFHVVLFPKDPHGLHPDEVTIAEILQGAGYATGCFGKWHLGDQPQFLPTNQGFGTYFGIPYSNDMWPNNKASRGWKYGCCPLPVMRDTAVVDIVEDMDDQAQLCKRFTDAATAFIRQNKDRPFFVYLPHAFVHSPRQARAPFMKQAGGNATRAQIEEVDWSVGQIMQTLEELDLADNTLVLFTSDNGAAGGCSSGPLRGGKGSTWEGGHRAPTIAWWRGNIPANSACDEICTAMDLLPTFVALAGGKVPDDRESDGKNITPLLTGEPGAKSPHEAFFYFHKDDLKAVRSGVWKWHTSGQLYNLDKDIGEKQNVAGQNPQVVSRLEGLMKTFSDELARNSRPVGKAENPQYLVPKDAGAPR